MKFLRRKQFESEMDVELRFHIDAYIEDLVSSGIERSEAERLARIEFGPIEAKKDECRQSWGLQWMDELQADLRYSFRMLRNHTGFAAVAILSLALGIGANTAIFGLIDAVMLRILPVREPERLVFIQNVGTQGQNGGPPYPCFELLRDSTKSFDGMAAFSPSNMELLIDGAREQTRGLWVSGSFYPVLGVKPIRGRTLSAADDQTPGKGGVDGPVAVISEAYWRQRFGGDPAVLGRPIPMYEHSITIVGVMPNEAMSLDPGRPFDIAVPMALSNPVMLREKGSWWLDVVARLKPGVPVEKARAEADTLFQAYMADVKTSPEIRKLAFDHIELTPAAKGMDGLRKRFSKPLLALMILAGLVLLGACANVASMMLARAASREKEFAVRLAIGAGRGRLIRQTLTEAMVLVGAASALGIVIAIEAERALAAYFAEGNSKIILDLPLDGRLLCFLLGVTALTGLGFGLLPALRAAGADPASGFQSNSRSVTGNRKSLRMGRALVILQVALSMVLLAGAGLFVRTLRQLESLDLGFAREGTLTMEVAPERDLFGKPEWLRLQPELLERVRAIPGVRSVSWSTMSPLSGRDRQIIMDVPGFVRRSETDKHVHNVSVSPDYFLTYGVPVKLGRVFTARDDSNAPKVAVMNETAVRFYFGNTNPIGARVTFPRGGDAVTYEIAGVVKDAKHSSLREEPQRFIYFPIAQSFDRIGRLALSVRTSTDPMGLVAAVTKEILRVRFTLLITNVSTLEKQVELSLMRERLVSSLSMAFGTLALFLACIGLYGILAYGVARRTNEIGIRMALGATRSGVTWLVLQEAAMLVVAGIVLGAPAVFALGTTAKSMLFGVEPIDLPALLGAVLPLLILAAIAGAVPALRAGRMDPMKALRCE